MSDTATETTEQQESTDEQQSQTETSETATVEEKDWQAEAEKWKSLARKHEGNAKANADKARQFDEAQEAQLSEIEKANKRAEKAEGDARETAGELALLRAGVKHKLTEDDLALVGTHGSAEEIEQRAERLAARLKESKPLPDFGGGDRGEDVAAQKQLTRAELARMSPEEIAQARKEGRLNQLLGITNP